MDFVTAWKASSIVLTGAFGILGLVKDYKDKTTNRITVWGRISLAGILLSTVLGVAAQLKESSDNAFKALALARKTDRTLQEVERLLTPLDEPRITVGFRLPCTDPTFERFCKLAREESLGSPDLSAMSTRLWKKWPFRDNQISLVLAVRIFKDKDSVEKYINGTMFAVGSDPTKGRWYGDMFIAVHAQNYGDYRNLSIVPEGSLDQIDLLIYEYQPTTVDALISSGRLISTADLSGATVILEEPVTNILDRLKVKFGVFAISFKNGQHFVAQEPLQQITLRGRTAYRCTLPMLSGQ